VRIGLVGLGVVLVFAACGGSTKRNFGGNAGGANAGSGGKHESGGSSGDASSDAGSAAEAGSEADGGSAGSSSSDAGASSDAGSGPGDGETLSIVSVTPSGATATTRDEISITFDRPVTLASAKSAISIKNGRGGVAGNLAVDGNVVRFTPRGSLCFDQTYTVSIEDTLRTADAIPLDEASSFSFKIPDGSWQAGVAVGPSGASVYTNGVGLDDDANAVVSWTEAAVPVVNYYDAGKRLWSGAVRPMFGDTSPSSGGRIAPKVRGAHAVAAFPGLGVAETSDGRTWSGTPVSLLLGSSGYFGSMALAMASDYTSALVWTDSHELKPASMWSAFHSPGSAWQAPTTAFVTPEAYAFELYPLPDSSFLAVYEHRLDQFTGGNVAVRRYSKAKGWSSEKALGAGAPPLVALDSFGNALVRSAGDLAARYDYAGDQWTPVAGVALAEHLALAGDGTGYAAYVGGSYSGKTLYVGLQRLVGDKWNAEEIVAPTNGNVLSLGGVAADDCGDVAVVWTDTDRAITYARRYTPASGWLPTVTLSKVKDRPYDIAGNAHGELIVPYTVEETASTTTPQIMRFQ